MTFEVNDTRILEEVRPEYVTLEQYGILEKPSHEPEISLELHKILENPISTTDYQISFDRQELLEFPNSTFQTALEQPEVQSLLDDLLHILPSTTPLEFTLPPTTPLELTLPSTTPLESTSHESNLFSRSSNININESTTVNMSPAANMSDAFCDKLPILIDHQFLERYLGGHINFENEDILNPPNNVKSNKSSKKRKQTGITKNEHQFLNTDHNYSILVEKKSKTDEIDENEADDGDDDDDDVSMCGSSFSSCTGEVVAKQGTTKYRERRKKNNIASKRSRETRKTKYVEMEAQATILEKDNEALKKRIAMLEQVTLQMKEILVKKFKGV